MQNGRPAAKLEHESATRVRARVVRPDRSPATMERLRRQLAKETAVEHVEVNQATGSVLVTGADRSRLRRALEEVLTIVQSIEDSRAREHGVDRVVHLVRTADLRIQERTSGRVSLRWVVPGVFVGLGLRELLRQGLTVGSVPWYVLLYYGVDSFLKLYPEHAPTADTEV